MIGAMLVIRGDTSSESDRCYVSYKRRYLQQEGKTTLTCYRKRAELIAVLHEKRVNYIVKVITGGVCYPWPPPPHGAPWDYASAPAPRLGVRVGIRHQDGTGTSLTSVSGSGSSGGGGALLHHQTHRLPIRSSGVAPASPYT